MRHPETKFEQGNLSLRDMRYARAAGPVYRAYIGGASKLYTAFMDVTITQFRRDLFKLVEQAMEGVEVHVTHKGKGFTLKPDEQPEGRLSRIKPVKIVRGSLEGASEQLYEEMQAEWEKDWAEL